MWIAVLAACRTGEVSIPGAEGAEGTDESSGEDDATHVPGTGVDDGGGDGGGDDDPPTEQNDWNCSEIFDQDRLPVYDMTIEEGDWHHLQSQWYTRDGTKDYVPITSLTVDGEATPDAMIRLKGNSGCCWAGEKMQFVIAFNEVDEDARFHGQRKVALDSPYYEPTVLKNRLAHWFLMKAGLPGSCTNNALFYVNGEYFGLYAHMEELDREYLERNFGKDAADGYLWKYGYVLDNHEGEEVDYTRINDFWSSYRPDDFVPLGEPDQWLAEWAAEAVLPDGDGYWCCGHNYYLYDHPTRGFLWIPWDKDGTFDWVPYNTDPLAIYYPTYTPHMASLLAVPEYEDAYIGHVALLTEIYGSQQMMDNLAAWTAQTYEWGLDDPYRYYDDSYYEYYLDSLPAFIEARREYLGYWTAHYAN